MVKVHREGFTALTSSEGTSSHRSLLKYDPTAAPPETLFLTLCSIIFIHGLRGHPRGSWVASPEKGEKPNDDTAGQRKDLKSVFGLRKSKTKPAETGEPPEIFWP